MDHSWMTKAELRKIYLGKRQLLSLAERELASAKIASQFFDTVDLENTNVLHCFVPIERFAEVDTRPIFQRLWSEYPEIFTAVPRVNHETEEIESLRYGPDTELVESKWQIGEPSHNERAEPKDVDLVLVPLVCCDLKGHRVGYGHGYYDRFLRKTRSDCLKIGLSIFPPVDAIDDAHEGDVRLDLCITPEQIYKF
jgi:5-formyltetrahydrofolate cyclo-ligase